MNINQTLKHYLGDGWDPHVLDDEAGAVVTPDGPFKFEWREQARGYKLTLTTPPGRQKKSRSLTFIEYYSRPEQIVGRIVEVDARNKLE